MRFIIAVGICLIVVSGCTDPKSKEIKSFVLENKDEFIGGTMINDVEVSGDVVFFNFYDSYEDAIVDFPYLGTMGTAEMFQDLFKDTNLELLITDGAASTFLAHPNVQSIQFDIDCKEPPLKTTLSRNLLTSLFANHLGADLNPADWKKNRDLFRQKVLYKEDLRKELIGKVDLE